jgi:conjugative relaxase-like TrwC/TraI family protein
VVQKGSAEVVGVPRALTTALSKRRAEIVEQLERLGRSRSAREAELAALSTRQAKAEFDLPEQRLEWPALAEEHGFGLDELSGRAEFRELEREEVGATSAG